MAPVAVFAVLLSAYLLTLLPGVGYSGDTAKFQFIGKVLGTPHNTGYPTYVLLNAVFVRLVPIGSLAMRANLLSAVCGAAACALLVDVLVRAGVRRLVAAVAALVLGLSFMFWSQSVVAEVYTLHLLLTVAVMWFLVRWRAERRDGLLLGAAAVVAVALGNHLMTLLLVPGIVVFVLTVDRRALLRPRLLLGTVLLLALGLGQYGFVLWRSEHPSPTTYVQSEAHTVPELVDVLRGKDFEDEFMEFSASHVLEVRVPDVRRYLREELSSVLALSLLGLVRRRRDPLTAMLLAWTVLDVAFVLSYGVIDVQVFMLPTYLCLMVWAAFGLGDVIDRLTAGRRSPLVIGLLVLPLAFFAWHVDTVDRSKNLDDAARVERSVDAAPDGAVIVAPDYQTTQFALYHLLGEGQAAARGLVVADRPDEDDVVAYLEGRAPLQVVGRQVTAVRPVVALGTGPAEEYRDRGLATEPLDDAVYRLWGGGELPARNR